MSPTHPPRLSTQLSPITGAQKTLATGTLITPQGLSIDPSGNLLIADAGAATIYRFNIQSGVRTAVTHACGRSVRSGFRCRWQPVDY